MNSISWFIYLTQVSDEVRGAAGVIAIFTAIFFGVWMLIGGAMKAMEDEDGAWLAFKVAFRSWGLWLFASLVVVSVVMPSRQTMLLIAGSELGERFVQSDTVRSVVDPGIDLLREWMRDETERLRASRTKSK